MSGDEHEKLSALGGGEPGAAPDAARAYVPPTALPPKLRRDTLELQAKVELAPNLDPRRAVTMPSLAKQAEIDERPTLPKRPPALAVVAGDATPFGPPVVLDAQAAKQPFAPRVMPAPPGLEGFTGAPPAPVAEPISPTPAGGVSLASDAFLDRVPKEVLAADPDARIPLPEAPRRKRNRWSTEPLHDTSGSIDGSALPSSHRPTALDDEVAPVPTNARPALLGAAVLAVAIGIVAVVALGRNGSAPADPRERAQPASQAASTAPAATTAVLSPAPPPPPPATFPEPTQDPPPATAAVAESAPPKPKPAATQPSKPSSPKPADTFRDIF